MAEAIWYFADGDEERGPVTEAQIRTLIGTGNLKADDLVWREGMDDWQPAGEVPGLFAGKTTAASTPSDVLAAPKASRQEKRPAARDADSRRTPASQRPTRARWDGTRPLEIFRPLGFLGQPLLLAGLLLVVGARGCESIADRYAERVASRADVAAARFEAQWQLRQVRLEQQLRELNRPDLSPAESNRQIALRAELQKINEQRQAELAALESGAWQELTIAAREARAATVMRGYWRSWVFWSGTLLLASGLSIIGFTGRGAERWMCLGMLGVVLYHLYSGRP